MLGSLPLVIKLDFAIILDELKLRDFLARSREPKNIVIANFLLNQMVGFGRAD